MKPRINPSILNCDISDLRGEIAKISNADMIHVDVMDNHFVPNLTWGLPVVEAVVNLPAPPVDTHLMIADPDRWAPAYAEAGSQSVTFHLEASAAPLRLAKELHRLGAQAGLGIKPDTPAAGCLEILPAFDMILVMTVEPGFGGQAFIDYTLPKIATIRAAISAANLPIAVQVDGGVTQETIVRAAEAGADVFVAGSAVFKAEDAHDEVDKLRQIAANHLH